MTGKEMTKLLACSEASVALCREDAAGKMELLVAAEGAHVRVMAHSGAARAFEHVVEGAQPSLVVLVPEGKSVHVKAELDHGATMMTLTDMASLDVRMRGGSTLLAGKAAQAKVCVEDGTVSLVSCHAATLDATGKTRVSVQGVFGALTVRGDNGTELYSRARSESPMGLQVSHAVRVARGSDQVTRIAPPSKALPPLVSPLKKGAKKGAEKAQSGEYNTGFVPLPCLRLTGLA